MRSTVEFGRRVLGAGIVIGLLAGCGVVEEPPPVVEKVTKAVETPQEKLLAATVTATTEPYSYTVVQEGDPTDEIKWSGAIDPAGKAYDFRIVNTYDEQPGLSLTLQYRVVGPKLWAKAKFAGRDDLALPEFTDKWMLVDRKRATGKSVPTEFGAADVDPGQLDALLTTVGVVTEAAPGKFTGTFDLTQQPDYDLVVPETRKALREKARSLPFTASVADGHVTDFVLWVPATAVSYVQVYAVKYSGFGTVKPITAPSAAETARTPDSLYEVLAD